MPNGYHGTDEDWKRLEAPLCEIDPAIHAFAKRHLLKVTRNYHDWPERSLRWGRDVERIIQIYLHDEQRLTWNFWLCAIQDRGQERFWKKQFLRQAVEMSEISPMIDLLLDEAYVAVNGWRPEDFEFATRLGR